MSGWDHAMSQILWLAACAALGWTIGRYLP
jgi:hypothetical protein